jgi:hypothetical protein
MRFGFSGGQQVGNLRYGCTRAPLAWAVNLSIASRQFGITLGMV